MRPSAGIYDGHKTWQKMVDTFNGETTAAWMTLVLRTILPQKATFFPMEMENSPASGDARCFYQEGIQTGISNGDNGKGNSMQWRMENGPWMGA